MKLSPNAPCPCGQGRKYKRCCGPLHRGKVANTPEALMRARYTAYTYHNVDYIINTTHPEGLIYQANIIAWRDELQKFCQETTFVQLKIVSTKMADEPEVGWVTFHVTLTQGLQDASFGERSRFERHQGQWKYFSGEVYE